MSHPSSPSFLFVNPPITSLDSFMSASKAHITSHIPTTVLEAVEFRPAESPAPPPLRSFFPVIMGFAEPLGLGWVSTTDTHSASVALPQPNNQPEKKEWSRWRQSLDGMLKKLRCRMSRSSGAWFTAGEA
jgi:hypothetical protein